MPRPANASSTSVCTSTTRSGDSLTILQVPDPLLPTHASKPGGASRRCDLDGRRFGCGHGPGVTGPSTWSPMARSVSQVAEQAPEVGRGVDPRVPGAHRRRGRGRTRRGRRTVGGRRRCRCRRSRGRRGGSRWPRAAHAADHLGPLLVDGTEPLERQEDEPHRRGVGRHGVRRGAEQRVQALAWASSELGPAGSPSIHRRALYATTAVSRPSLLPKCQYVELGAGPNVGRSSRCWCPSTLSPHQLERGFEVAASSRGRRDGCPPPCLASTTPRPASTLAGPTASVARATGPPRRR